MNYLVGDILELNDAKSKKLVSIKSIKNRTVNLNEYDDEFFVDDLVPIKLTDNRISNIYLDMVVMASVLLPGQKLPRRTITTLDKLLSQKEFSSVVDLGEIKFVHQFQKFLIEKNGKEWKLKPSK